MGEYLRVPPRITEEVVDQEKDKKEDLPYPGRNSFSFSFIRNYFDPRSALLVKRYFLFSLS